jgi:hypothetical protein
MLWKYIQDWIASKGGFAHVVAVLFLGAVSAYASVPAFASLINHIYAAMPAWAHELLLAVLGVVAWYKNTQGATQAYKG